MFDVCDELCFKNNKYKKSIDLGNCEIAKISLDVILIEENLNRELTYTVTNTGTTDLCNDIYICSKIFGKLKIENKFLLEGDSVAVTKSITENLSIENEICRAFVRVNNDDYIYSDSVEIEINPLDGSLQSKEILELPDGTVGGVHIISTFVRNVNINSTDLACRMANSKLSPDATNVRFTIKYTGGFSNPSNIILFSTFPNKFQFTKEADGIKGYIPLWKKNEVYSFRIRTTTVGMPRPIMFPFFFKLESDNKFSQFSNYITLPDNIQH